MLLLFHGGLLIREGRLLRPRDLSHLGIDRVYGSRRLSLWPPAIG